MEALKAQVGSGRGILDSRKGWSHGSNALGPW